MLRVFVSPVQLARMNTAKKAKEAVKPGLPEVRRARLETE